MTLISIFRLLQISALAAHYHLPTTKSKLDIY